MTLNTIICGYIYAGFLVIQAALEAGLLYAKAIIKSIDSLVMAIENMIKLTCLAILDAALSAYQVLCKYLTDWLMQKTHANKLLENFCKSIFKCSYVLKELLNPNSAITKTLVKNAEYDATAQAALYQDIASFDTFRQQICSAGFTFCWGLNYLRDYGEEILAQINEWVDIITRNRIRIRKKLESYFYAIEDYGILDLLRQLAAFFNCVLSPSDQSCASIATATNFYKKCTGALHVTKIGHNQFKLTDSWVTQQLGTCDKISKQLNAVKNNLAKALTDAGLTSKNIANAQAAYNLADFVRETKRAIDSQDYTRIPGVKLATSTWDDAKAFGTALSDAFGKLLDGGASSQPTTDSSAIDISFDFLLENSEFTSDGRLIVNIPGHDAVDLTNELFPNGDIQEIEMPVLKTEIDSVGASINKLYWTEDGILTTVGGAAIALTTDNPTDLQKRIADDIIAKMSVIYAVSDTTNVVTSY